MKEIDPEMSGEADLEHEQDLNEESGRQFLESIRRHAENVEPETILLIQAAQIPRRSSADKNHAEI